MADPVAKDVDHCCRTQPLAKLSPFLAATVANLVTMLPAEAATGKIFDFNLTFFFMIGEFLLLMVFLEKTWFTPVGKVLDDRDSYIRDKLSSVGVSPCPGSMSTTVLPLMQSHQLPPLARQQCPGGVA